MFTSQCLCAYSAFVGRFQENGTLTANVLARCSSFVASAFWYVALWGIESWSSQLNMLAASISVPLLIEQVSQLRWPLRPRSIKKLLQMTTVSNATGVIWVSEEWAAGSEPEYPTGLVVRRQFGIDEKLALVNVRGRRGAYVRREFIRQAACVFDGGIDDYPSLIEALRELRYRAVSYVPPKRS